LQPFSFLATLFCWYFSVKLKKRLLESEHGMCKKGTVGVVKCISQGLGKPSLIVSKMKLGKPKSLLVMNPGCQQPRSCSNRYQMKKQNKTKTNKQCQDNKNA